MGWAQLIGGAAGYYLTGGSAAGAAAGAALGGGLDEATGGGSSGAAREAANTSAAANDRALALQQRMYEEGVARQQPRLAAGNNALAQMQSGAFAQPAAFKFGAGDYQADPGYAFRIAEGQKALDRQAAARGGLMSGSALKAAARYGQDMGSQEFGNAYSRALDAYNADVARSNTGYNRLAGLADVGQTAGTQIGNAGQSYATNAGNLMINQGDIQGNAMIAAERARQSAYGNIGKALGSGGFDSLVSGFYGPGQYNQRMGVNFNDPYTYG
jgi:hypothetical protein